MACSNDCCSIEEYKCPNFLLCGSYETQELLDDNNGLCIYCNIMNNELQFEENKDCIICLKENNTVVCFDIKCSHHICIDCYKKKYLFVNDKDDKGSIFNVCSICNIPDTENNLTNEDPK